MLDERNKNRPHHYNVRYRDGLSPRETEILSLVSKGKTNVEIAAEVGLGYETVKWHVSAILQKLEVASREEASAYWKYDHSFRGKMHRAWVGFTGLLLGKATLATAGLVMLAGLLMLGVLAWPRPESEVENSPAVAATATPQPGLRIAQTYQLPKAMFEEFVVLNGAIWGRYEIRIVANQTFRDPDPVEPLVRFDPATGAVTEIPIGPAAGGVVAVGDSLWMSGPYNNNLTEVDSVTGKVLRTVPLPLPQRYGSFTALTAHGENIWAVSRGFGTVLRVSAVTGEVVAEAKLDLPGPVVLAYESLWVPLMDGFVARLHPDTLEVRALIPLGITTPNPGTFGLAASEGSVWAVSYSPVDFRKVDAGTNTVIDSFTFAPNEVSNVYANGSMAVDEDGDIWWVNPGGNNPVGQLLRLDTETGEIADEFVMATDPSLPVNAENAGGFPHPTVSPHGLVVEPDGIWVVTGEGDLIRVARPPKASVPD